MIALSNLDLAIAAGLMLILAALSWHMHLGVGRSLLVASARMMVQLALLGLVLKVLFAAEHPGWVALMALVMLLIAGREVHARQKRPLTGAWGLGLGTASMGISASVMLIIALAVLVQPDPWWSPQYLIPLLGMLLGNTLTAIALTLDRISNGCWQQREEIEARLALGMHWQEASGDIQREAIRTGLTGIINSMAVAGLVSLPGMMTGQILAGADPMEAVRYQILIMLLIAAATGLGAIIAVRVSVARLFDERQRLRLERLHDQH